MQRPHWRNISWDTVIGISVILFVLSSGLSFILRSDMMSVEGREPYVGIGFPFVFKESGSAAGGDYFFPLVCLLDFACIAALVLLWESLRPARSEET